jgi:membrane protein implicated in regulation of membrane protease activity
MNALMIYWLAAGLVLIMIELGHPGLFFFLSFALGAFVASGSSLFIPSLIHQVAICLASSMLALVLLRGIVSRWLRVGSHHQTNVYGLIGKRGSVLKPIQAHQPGQVKIKGDIWLAYSLHHKPIASGEVVVVNVSGSHIIVHQDTHKD